VRSEDRIIILFENLLQESEKKLQNILKISRDVIYQLNLRTMKYDYITMSSEDVLGYTPEEIRALGFGGVSSLIHPDDRNRVDEYFEKLKSCPAEEFSGAAVDYRFRHKELGYRRLSETCYVMFDKIRIPALAAGNIRDITVRRKSGETLQIQKKKLEISENNLREFSRKILAIREEEKEKLAIDLHDEIGSMAVAVNSNLDIAKEDIKDKDFKAVSVSIIKAKKALGKAIDNLKKLAVDLRPPDLDMVGLSGALKEYFSGVEEQTKIRIDFKSDIKKRKLGEDVTLALYRISHEAMNNIIRHAGAKKVKIRLYFRKNRIKFDICDDGKGFDVKSLQPPHASRMGIWGMRERAESLGGVFVIKSSAGKGAELNISLPC